MPKPPIGGNALHGSRQLGLLCGTQIAPRAIEPDCPQIRHGCHAQGLFETVLQGAPAHMKLAAQLGHRNRAITVGEDIVAHLHDDPIAIRFRPVFRQIIGSQRDAQIEQHGRDTRLYVAACNG
ncbi:hypothetical protein ABH944_005558 [Caballeronia udeis]|uniref:Uncharacterized protein n=1 Tax=Caballeronia udeis TaxID=1232866 RepID=A0ABW8MPX0_9BURK